MVMPTAPAMRKIQTGDGADNVDYRGNHGNDKGLSDPRIGEERCAVVEDKVNTTGSRQYENPITHSRRIKYERTLVVATLGDQYQ